MTRTGKGQQREFLYVFDSKASRGQVSAEKKETDRPVTGRRSTVSSDEAKAVREKLIAELKKFGC